MTYSEPARTAARGKRRPLAALAVVALIAAGCGSSAESDPGSSSNGNATARDAAVEFAACMRENGVHEFPDPDASGELTIDAVANGSSLDTSSATWKTAVAACKDVQPAGFMGHRRSAEQQAAALEFAQCMRDNGQEDFPDPAPDGPLINVNGALSIPGFRAASEKCLAVSAGELGLRRE